MQKIINLYEPLEWQIAPWRDTSPDLLLTGAAGGGKSRLAAEKIHAYCLKYPNSTALMVRKTKTDALKSIVPFMKKTVIGDDHRVRFVNNTFYYYNGSVIYHGGMHGDAEREGIRSIGGEGGLDIAWMEEAIAFTRKDKEELSMRLRHTSAPWQQLIMTTNPDTPYHWIYKDIIQGGNGSVYYSTFRDNPHNAKNYVNRLEKISGVMHDRMVLGKWCQAEGIVYDEYDASVHLIDSFEIPKEWDRFRSIDFGYTNPFVCQWWARDTDGNLYRYRELYKTRVLVEDHAKTINEHSQGERYVSTVADHDAEDRATLERHGIKTKPAIKEVKAGIQATKELLTIKPNGKPSIYLLRDSLIERDEYLYDEGKPTCTEEEIVGYVWRKFEDGKMDKEEPVKLDDHGMDTMRYLAMEAKTRKGWYAV
jgi:PBSX family phage terminase large subunit